MIARAALVIALVLGLQARAARADDRPWAEGVSAAAQKRALDLFEQGNKLFVDKSYAAALKLYRDAITSWDHPSIRFNMVECLISLDQPLEAYDQLIAALRFGEPALGAADFERATRTKQLLEGQIARVEVTCAEPGAVVALDGKRLFVAPGTATRTILPGSHQVVATKPGFETLTRDEVMLPRKTTVIQVELSRTRTLAYRWQRWKPWAVVGGGVVVAALGIVFRLGADSAYGDLQAELAVRCPLGCLRATLPAGVAGLEARGERLNAAAITSFTVGGTAIAAGLLLVLLNNERFVEQSGPGQPALRVTGSSASLAWQF